MKNLFIIIVILVFHFSIACTTKEAQPEDNQESVDLKLSSAESNVTSELSAEQNNALPLMVSLCFTCHHPDHGASPRLAPPMFKVREHYFKNGISRDEFVSRITSYALNPTQEASIMPGAVRNFGLMPKAAFKPEDVSKIAAYIYDNDLSSEGWREEWKKFQEQNHSQTNK
jgi:cytochrome c553